MSTFKTFKVFYQSTKNPEKVMKRVVRAKSMEDAILFLNNLSKGLYEVVKIKEQISY